jgi:hypothetical protein
MVKNTIGGNKSKNISSKVTKKKIIVEEPDLENSFFATVTQKPNGLMCKVKIIQTIQSVKELIKKKGIDGEIQVNIGKLKHDKRNNMIALGDIVQVEFIFDMNRKNGEKYGSILCKYDTSKLKEFKKLGILKLDDDCDELNFSDSEELENIKEINKEEIESSDSEKIKEDLNDEDIDLEDL